MNGNFMSENWLLEVLGTYALLVLAGFILFAVLLYFIIFLAIRNGIVSAHFKIESIENEYEQDARNEE